MFEMIYNLMIMGWVLYTAGSARAPPPIFKKMGTKGPPPSLLPSPLSRNGQAEGAGLVLVSQNLGASLWLVWRRRDLNAAKKNHWYCEAGPEVSFQWWSSVADGSGSSIWKNSLRNRIQTKLWSGSRQKRSGSSEMIRIRRIRNTARIYLHISQMKTNVILACKAIHRAKSGKNSHSLITITY